MKQSAQKCLENVTFGHLIYSLQCGRIYIWFQTLALTLISKGKNNEIQFF
jgi:hypothetical protein